MCWEQPGVIPAHGREAVTSLTRTADNTGTHTHSHVHSYLWACSCLCMRSNVLLVISKTNPRRLLYSASRSFMFPCSEVVRACRVAAAQPHTDFWLHSLAPVCLGGSGYNNPAPAFSPHLCLSSPCPPCQAA